MKRLVLIPLTAPSRRSGFAAADVVMVLGSVVTFSIVMFYLARNAFVALFDVISSLVGSPLI